MYFSKLILAGIFIYFLVKRIIKYSNYERATKLSIEAEIGNFPSLNICPSYNVDYNHSFVFDFDGTYKLEDFEKLPSMRNILQPEFIIYFGTEE